MPLSVTWYRQQSGPSSLGALVDNESCKIRSARISSNDDEVSPEAKHLAVVEGSLASSA